jgi:MFS transporter, DHA3 family, macrolide efflux protein
MFQANSLVITLRNRDFRYLFIGQFISQMGDIFILMAVLITLQRLAGSKGALAMLVISFSLPTLIFGIIGGVFIDRLNRKVVMIASDLIRAALVPCAIFVQAADAIWLYYLLAFLIATVGVFFIPARNASLPNLVPNEQLLAANGLVQFTQVAALVGGAALAGYVISLAGTNFAFIFDSFTFVASAFFILLIRLPQPNPRASKASRDVLWQQTLEGLGYIRAHRNLKHILIMAGVGTLGVTAITVLGVAYLDEVLGPLYRLELPEPVKEIALSVASSSSENSWNDTHRRLSVQLGVMISVLGLGMVGGTLLIGGFGARARDSQIVSSALTIMGGAILAFALAPNFGLVLAATAIIGLTVVIARSSLATLTQRLVPDEKRGRVESVVNLIIGVGTVMSTALSGWLSEITGVRGVFVICAGLTLAVAGGAFVVLRDLDRPLPKFPFDWPDALDDDRLVIEREGA